MSGRAKRICYTIVDILLFAGAIAAAVLAVLFRFWKQKPEWGEIAAAVLVLLALLLRATVWVHEGGHLLFGLLCGMKLISLSVEKRNGEGRIEMIPKNGKHVRGKLLFFALGGAAMNLAAGGALYALRFSLAYHPALLFCELLAPFMIAEGIRSLIPAQLPEGKTDGGIVWGTIFNRPEEEIMLRVLEAQGILLKKPFSEIERRRLFEVPVVREDLPAYSDLLFLQAMYLLDAGEEASAKEILLKLNSLGEYLEEEEEKEVLRYLRFFEGEFSPKEQKLFGVCELEKKLKSVNDKKE